MKTQNIVLIVLSVLLVISVILGSEFSVVGESDVTLYEDLSCQEADECYDKLISLGFPKSELDNQLETLELVCIDNTCGVRE